MPLNYIQIPNLPPAVALNGQEQIEAVQNGVSVRIFTGQLITAGSTGIVVGFTHVVGGVVGDLLVVGSGGVVSQYTMAQLQAAITASLPLSNPHVVGAWWLNGEVVSVSQG